MSYKLLTLQGPASAPPALRPAMSDPIERSALGLRRRKSTRISDADAATAAAALAGEPFKLLLLSCCGCGQAMGCEIRGCLRLQVRSREQRNSASDSLNKGCPCLMCHEPAAPSCLGAWLQQAPHCPALSCRADRQASTQVVPLHVSGA